MRDLGLIQVIGRGEQKNICILQNVDMSVWTAESVSTKTTAFFPVTTE